MADGGVDVAVWIFAEQFPDGWPIGMFEGDLALAFWYMVALIHGVVYSNLFVNFIIRPSVLFFCAFDFLINPFLGFFYSVALKAGSVLTCLQIYLRRHIVYNCTMCLESLNSRRSL